MFPVSVDVVVENHATGKLACTCDPLIIHVI